jgi:hypothetical protein
VPEPDISLHLLIQLLKILIQALKNLIQRLAGMSAFDCLSGGFSQAK